MEKKPVLPIVPHYLNISQACKYLGISRITLIQAETRQLILPERTPGGHRRYNFDNLVKFKGIYGQLAESAGDTKTYLENIPVGYSQFLSLEAALRQIILLLQGETGGVFLLDKERRRLILSTSFGVPRWLLNKELTVGLEGISGRALTSLEPVIFTSTESELPMIEPGRGQGICVPLLAEQEKLGTLHVFSSQRNNFFPGEISILTTFASLYSMLIVSKWLLDQPHA